MSWTSGLSLRLTEPTTSIRSQNGDSFFSEHFSKVDGFIYLHFYLWMKQQTKPARR